MVRAIGTLVEAPEFSFFFCFFLLIASFGFCQPAKPPGEKKNEVRSASSSVEVGYFGKGRRGCRRLLLRKWPLTLRENAAWRLAGDSIGGILLEVSTVGEAP